MILREGSEEMERSTPALAWSGLGAGLSMGLSFLTQGLLRAEIPDLPWTRLIVLLGYPLGFVVAILGRQQLFTEDTLTPIVPLLTYRDRDTFYKVLKLWGIVLITNAIGAGLFGWACNAKGIFGDELQMAFQHVSLRAVNGSFGSLFFRAIFAGWLIALLTWVLSGIKSTGAALTFVLTYVVGLGNFPHIVAGTSEAAYLAIAGQISWGKCLLGFMAPALLGNIVGGVGLVALLNHAQVVSNWGFSARAGARGGQPPSKSQSAG